MDMYFFNHKKGFARKGKEPADGASGSFPQPQLRIPFMPFCTNFQKLKNKNKVCVCVSTTMKCFRITEQEVF